MAFLKFNVGDSYLLTLKYNTPKEKDGKYGLQYWYSVDAFLPNGTPLPKEDEYPWTWAATESQHALVRDNNIGQGDTIGVWRREEKEYRIFHVKPDGSKNELFSKRNADGSDPFSGNGNNGGNGGNGNGAAQARGPMPELAKLYETGRLVAYAGFLDAKHEGVDLVLTPENATTCFIALKDMRLDEDGLRREREYALARIAVHTHSNNSEAPDEPGTEEGHTAAANYGAGVPPSGDNGMSANEEDLPF